MGQTAGGLPWPEGTDKVRDGDNAIRALADALQARGHGLRVEARRVQVTTNAAGVAVVNFASPFPSPPILSVICGSGDIGGFFLTACLYDPQNDTGGRFSVGVRNEAANAAFAGTFFLHYWAIGTYS